MAREKTILEILHNRLQAKILRPNDIVTTRFDIDVTISLTLPSLAHVSLGYLFTNSDA